MERMWDDVVVLWLLFDCGYSSIVKCCDSSWVMSCSVLPYRMVIWVLVMPNNCWQSFSFMRMGMPSLRRLMFCSLRPKPIRELSFMVVLNFIMG